MGKSMVRRGRRRGRAAQARLVGRIRGGVVLTARAKARLDLVDWHHAHGGNVSRTARHFGYSRPTVYRWLGRYDRHRLEPLEDPPSPPAPPPPADLDRGAGRGGARAPRVLSTLGQGQARRPPAARGSRLSCSMVGRILARLRRNGDLREPVGRRISVRRRRWARPYAVRKPADWRVERPGDLVELDTLDVRPPGATHPLKQFTARDGSAAGTWSSCAAMPWPARRPRSSTRSPRGCPSRSAPSASRTGVSSWPSSRRPARSGVSACTSCRPARPS